LKTVKKIVVTEEIEVVDEIRCNNCSELCSTSQQEEMYKNDWTWKRSWYGLIETSFTTGYFSDLPDDMTYTFSLCESCLKSLMNGFKLPAQSSGGFFGD